MKLYKVTLDEEKKMLQELIFSGKMAVRKITYTRILLLADENSEEGGNTDQSIVNFLQVGVVTVK